MKPYLISITCLFTCIFHSNELAGQFQIKIDSLKKELRATSIDSSKVYLYADISKTYARTRIQLDSAHMYADSVRWVSEKNNFEEGTALSSFCYGLIYRYSGDFAEGLEHLKIYTNYLEQSGDSIALAIGLYPMGVIHRDLGNYQESLSIYNRILAINERQNREQSIGTLLNSMGHIQKELDKDSAAINSYEKSIAIMEKYKDSLGLAISLEALGSIYIKLKEFNRAEFFLRKALVINERRQVQYLRGNNYSNLGFMHFEMNNNQEALKFYMKALKIRENLPAKDRLARSLSEVGQTNLRLRNLSSAEIYLKKSLKISKEINAKPVLLWNYETLVDLNKLKGDYKSALHYQILLAEMNDSVFNAEKIKQFAALETRFELSQKDKEITLLTKEKELQEAKSEKEATLRKALYGGLIALGIIAGLIFYTMRQRLRNQKIVVAKNEEITRAKLSEELQTLEMKALRAQMNPHFLFNSLNSINTMILNDESDSASRYLSKFSKLVRLMLENSEQSKVTLKDELDTLEAYIQLEAIRFNNKMDYKIEVDKAIDQEATFLPSMVLQPFVENAIWHGLLHKDKKGLLTIKIKEDEDNLLCSIIDNGVGRERSLSLKKEGGLKKKSMGIKITTDRLKLLTKQKIKDVINIIDLKDLENNALGTQVNIQIPLS